MVTILGIYRPFPFIREPTCQLYVDKILSSLYLGKRANFDPGGNVI